MEGASMSDWRKEESEPAVPPQTVVMWAGSPSAVPGGWTLCDGSSPAGVDISVPDLRNRFVVGAGDSYETGETGGEESVQLTLDEIAAHDHGDGNLSASNHSHGNGSLSASGHSHSDGSLSTNNQGGHSHSYERASQSNQSVGYEETTVWGGPVINGINQQNADTGTSGSHSHSVRGNTGSSGANVTGSTSGSGAGVNGSTSSAGGNDAHENRPPFYALAYIMNV